MRVLKSGIEVDPKDLDKLKHNNCPDWCMSPCIGQPGTTMHFPAHFAGEETEKEKES